MRSSIVHAIAVHSIAIHAIAVHAIAAHEVRTVLPEEPILQNEGIA